MATSAEQYHQYPPPSGYSQQYQQHQQYQQQQYPQQQYPQQQQQQQQQPQKQQQYPQQQLAPSPPSHQRRPSQVPSSHSRTFSFHSQKSHKSSGSKDLHETHAEKESKRLHSKADPTLAMSEAEPSMVAAMQAESSWAPLRSMQHKDLTGNAIGEPDLSNPTRNRWERPLDTIRSFEAAIDGGYSRKSLIRSETDHVANWNRRNSSFTGGQPRYANDAYYNNRPISLRPDTAQFDMGPRGNQFDGQAYNNSYGSGPSRQRMTRMQTDSQFQGQGRNQHIYPQPHKDRSYETVTSAAGSGNSEQAGYQTDPTSSDNSSIDRTMPAKRHEPINEYGPGPSYPQQSQQRRPLAPGADNYGGPVQTQPASQPPQAPPTAAQVAPLRQKNTLLRRTSTQQSHQTQQTQPTEAAEKRKSWFSRRFSKNA